MSPNHMKTAVAGSIFLAYRKCHERRFVYGIVIFTSRLELACKATTVLQSSEAGTLEFANAVGHGMKGIGRCRQKGTGFFCERNVLGITGRETLECAHDWIHYTVVIY